ncbi:MAG: DinB family protein [Deltaproteobacteria bacterium]|nr:DinB family protein [Deltaproteobacteria bacterium]
MENDREALAELERLGLRKVPVTVAGTTVVVGFNREGLARLFKLEGATEAGRADTWLFSTLDKVLEAVIRAALQVPPNRLSWHTPDRNRPLKVFCYHILADPSHVLDAIESQKYDGSFKFTYEEAAGRFPTMDALAQFGEQTRIRLSQAAEELTEALLDRPIEGYAGATNGHELLRHVLSHTAHHLRQLYEMLRAIGVEPIRPLGEEDFKGIRLPESLW